ncbi:zinc finger protein [Abeliophyllum distichum]|uniref:Zinc finger protein n=1 Tax=Abeliophyllum distichum TaxID=126358 RepID=A0ABD1VW67_9LAMI
MAYNRSDDDFSGLNDIPIPEDIIDQFGGSTDPIDLEDVHDDADTQTTIGSSTKRKATKQKAKCWDHFELVPTGKIVNDLPEFKAQCKHFQEKFAWQKGIGTTHLNRHYKKCQYKYGGLDTIRHNSSLDLQELGPVLPLSTTGYIHKNSCDTKDCRN